MSEAQPVVTLDEAKFGPTLTECEAEVSRLEKLKCSSWNMKQLLSSRRFELSALQHIQKRSATSEEEKTRCVLDFLAAYIHNRWAAPDNDAGGQLEMIMLATDYFAPLMCSDGGVAVPQQITSDMTLDNVPELSRILGAALIALLVYLTCRQKAGDSFPPDHSATMFVILAMQSLRTVEQAAAIDAQLVAAGGGVTATELRWLAHHIMASILEAQGVVHMHTESHDKLQEGVEELQKNCMMMIKAMPSVPSGFARFAECAASGQQRAAAAKFAERGLEKAVELGADLDAATLGYMLAGLTMLGGLGDSWTVGEVAALQQAAEAREPGLLAWLPAEAAERLLNNFEPWKSELPGGIMAQVTKQFGEVQPDTKLPPATVVFAPSRARPLPAGALVRE